MIRFLIFILAFLMQGVMTSAQQTSLLIQVKGACGMCQDRIEGIAIKQPHVLNAIYTLEKEELLIKIEQGFHKTALVSALLSAGHDTEGQKAADEVYLALPDCCHYREDEEIPTAPAIENNGNIISLEVSGECGMCEERIESTALNVIGVSFADYDLASKKLAVEIDPNLFQKNELVKALLAVGHDTDGQTAPKAVYDELPACCQYREVKLKKHPEGSEKKSKSLYGTVFEKTASGKLQPLIGATLVWENTNVGTSTDLDGKFDLPTHAKVKKLIVTYVGYIPDTLVVEKAGMVNIVISENPVLLDAVEITYRKRSTEISFLDVVKVQNITSKELLKAACCNLAESFDTTPAVDASMTDAVTGTRKIELLGLAGPYVQITRENIPDVRGLAAVQGLAYTPGPWIEGMQLNMGAGSVVNGFESITGQINVEMKKPCNEDNTFFNVYASQAARLEMNTFSKQTVNENWSTATLLHASTRNQRRDHNHDGFLDMPLGNQFGFTNRWKWTDNNGQEGQIGAKITFMNTISGQTDFDPSYSVRNQVWGADMVTKRAEVWGKRGFVNLDTPQKTLGLQFAAVYHDQKSQFGLRRYDAVQQSVYMNIIRQTTLWNNDHQVRAGGSFQYDRFDEVLAGAEYQRREAVPGVFGEYTYKGSDKVTLLVGGRADYHSQFGLFFTPRLNMRYAPDPQTVFRFAAGRGQKTASIFAENIGLLASNRTIIVESESTSLPYGLRPEIAWNMGVSMTREFKIGKRIQLLSFDFNRIDFENQIVVDLDRTARQVVFYNLRGQSYANSFQAQADLDLADWFEVRLAYRYNDVKTTYGEVLLQKPLTSPHRAFVNTVVKPGRGWSIDFTLNRLSGVRIPSTAANDEAHQWPTQSPSFYLANAQLSKNWKETFEIYLGGENIFNYRLKHPIIGSHAPFGEYFDSSLAWGPVMGINVYMGVRYSIRE